MPKETLIQHGDLSLLFDHKQNVKLSRTSDGSWCVLSLSEWAFVIKCAELLNWPTISPQAMEKIIADHSQC